MAVVTRWFWVRHAPVINPDHIVYGASDMPVDVSETHMFAPAARALPAIPRAMRCTSRTALICRVMAMISSIACASSDARSMDSRSGMFARQLFRPHRSLFLLKTY